MSNPPIADELVIRAHEAVLKKWPDQRVARISERVKHDPLHTPTDPDAITEEFLEDRRRFTEGKSRYEIIRDRDIAFRRNFGVYAVTVGDWSTLTSYEVTVYAIRGDISISAPSDAPSEVEEYVRDAFE